MSKHTNPPGSHNNSMSGFTLVELMVATLVFATVLLMITVAVIQINRVYYKGVTESNTQNVARNIVDTLSQAIQFNAGSVDNTPDTPPPEGTQQNICIGDQQFVFIRGYRLVNGSAGTHETNQALLQQTAHGDCAPPPSPLPANFGRELLTPGMRLSNLEVRKVDDTNLYKLSVTVSYGNSDAFDDDLATAPKCQSLATNNQFCSVSEINTVVEKRVGD